MLNPETLCLKVLKNRKAYRTSLVQACVGQAARKPKAKPKRRKKKAGMGSSNQGEYPRVNKSDFAGPSGGAAERTFPVNTIERGRAKTIDFAGKAGGAAARTFPVNTIERGRAALRLAYNAPDPEGIRSFVYKKYPSLRP